jgi:hypothetical protein
MSRHKREQKAGVPVGAGPDLTGQRGPTGNVFIGTLNVIVSPVRAKLGPIAKAGYRPLRDHYHLRYHRRWPKFGPTVLMIDLTLLGLAALGLVGGILAFYLLPTPLPFAGPGLKLAEPPIVQSGAPTGLTVWWHNDSTAAIGCAAVRLDLPSNVLVGGGWSEAETAARCRPPQADWSGAAVIALGDLGPHARGRITVPVTFFGTPGDTVTAAAELTYWLSGQAVAARLVDQATWLIDDSALSLAWELPPRLVRGAATALRLRYENKSAAALAGVRVQIATPPDFGVTGSEPTAEADGGWRLGDVEPGEGGVITLHGRLSGRPTGAVVAVTANATSDVGDLDRPLSELRVGLDPRAAALAVRIEQVGRRQTHVRSGETVGVAVRLTNQGETALRHLKVSLPDDIRAWLPDTDGSALTWDEAAAPALAELAAGATAELAASLPFRADLAAVTDQVTLKALAEYELADEPGEAILTDSPPLDLVTVAAPKFEAAALYYANGGDQLGLGPLPPRVGETTKYWVFFKVRSEGGALKTAEAQGMLPPGVQWTGRVSALSGAAPSFDAAARRVRWQAELVEPGRPAIAGFEVAFTPTADLADAAAALLLEPRLRAVDLRTGIGLDDRADDVTTDLVADGRAAGLGKVLE